MSKHRIISVFLIIISIFVGYFVYSSQINESSRFPFRLGLDLNGGTQLVYRADTSNLASGNVSGAMDSLRDVIERRVNMFGVSEPVVQVEESNIISGVSEHRLIVELPGVTDIEEAIELIGKTPQLEFILIKQNQVSESSEENPDVLSQDVFVPTGITGQYLEGAQLQFTQSGTGQVSGMPIVGLTFNNEGKDILAQVTRDNRGEVMAIFLDGVPISSPVINDEITDGKAVISGNFTPEEARSLVRDLNYGALPVPIELVSTQTVGASLGQNAQSAGIKAGILGLIILIAFLIFWYRLPGLIASLSLFIYIILSLAIFKLIPVTLTAAGIAGFILSIGMAVDSNVLIFERTKEELKKGKSIRDSLQEGFARAWLSIRDSNISTIITSIILFWLGTSSVQGFALTLGVGVLVSLFTATTVSRTFLFAIAPKESSKLTKFLFSNGLHI